MLCLVAHANCTISAESILRLTFPSTDLYLSRYVCGKWSGEHPIPDTSLTNSWFEERRERVFRKIRELLKENVTNSNAPWAVKQAKIFYDSCMDVRTLVFS